MLRLRTPVPPPISTAPGILSNGGGFTEDGLMGIGRLHDLKGLCIDNSLNVTDRVLGAIGRLPELEYLSLELFEVSRDALQSLDRLESLRRLRIQATPTEVDHSHILVHEQLTLLDLFAAGNTPEKADQIAELVWGLAELQVLRLAGYRASDQVLAGLASLQELRSVALGGNRRLGDQAAKTLGGLPQLRELTIDATGVTDDGLRDLGQSRSLELLDLRKCRRFAEVGVEYLTRLPTLQLLMLKGCDQLSSVTVRSMASRMPYCCVQFPDGTLSWKPDRWGDIRNRRIQ